MPRRIIGSVAVVVLVGSVASCSGRDHASAPTTRVASSPTVPPSSTQPSAPIPGKITGRVRFHDIVWGDLVAVTSVVYNPGYGENGCGDAHLRVVDTAQHVRLRRDWDWGCGEARPNRPATDVTGNVFIYYNPGRYDGVIILRAAGGELRDFGTLPPSSNTKAADATDDYEGSGPFGYYTNTAPDPTAHGRLEIKQFANNCDPSCAGGHMTLEIFRWDGHGYARQRSR